MKNLKKTICLILAVVMLISAVPMQSFALLEKLLPKVVEVELTDNIPVSNKFVQGSADTYPDTVILSDCNYTFKLHFSNGRTVETDSYYLLGEDLLSGVSYSYVSMSVDSADCAEAIAEGKGTVKVNLSVFVVYIDGSIKFYSFEKDKPIADEIVRDVTLIDPMPENYNKLDPTADFVGKSFRVEYSDGSEEVLILEDLGDKGYYLGEESVYMWYGEDCYKDSITGETVYYEGLEFDYMDTYVVLERKFIPCPFSSFEVTDYELNGKAGLTALSYKLTYKDGRAVEKSFTFDTPVTNEDYVVIDTVDGYDVSVIVEGWSDYYYIDAGIGYTIWEIEDYIEGDIKDFCDCRCHKHDFLSIVIHTLICKVWEIFRIKEYCECGYWHW